MELSQVGEGRKGRDVAYLVLVKNELSQVGTVLQAGYIGNITIHGHQCGEFSQFSDRYLSARRLAKSIQKVLWLLRTG